MVCISWYSQGIACLRVAGHNQIIACLILAKPMYAFILFNHGI